LRFPKWSISVFRSWGLYRRAAGVLVTVVLVQRNAFIFQEQLTQKRNEPPPKTLMCDKQTAAAHCNILTAHLHYTQIRTCNKLASRPTTAAQSHCLHVMRRIFFLKIRACNEKGKGSRYGNRGRNLARVTLQFTLPHSSLIVNTRYIRCNIKCTRGEWSDISKICALLGYCAAYSGNAVPTVRYILSAPSSRVKKSKKKFKSWIS
jgi:hypothetical protein